MVEGCSFGKGVRELLSKKTASEQTPEEVRKPSTGAPSRPALDRSPSLAEGTRMEATLDPPGRGPLEGLAQP